MSRRVLEKVTKSLCICDFCGKTEEEVEKMIAGPKNPLSKQPDDPICICNECVDLCIEIVVEGREKKAGDFPNDPPG